MLINIHQVLNTVVLFRWSLIKPLVGTLNTVLNIAFCCYTFDFDVFTGRGTDQFVIIFLVRQSLRFIVSEKRASSDTS